MIKMVMRGRLDVGVAVVVGVAVLAGAGVGVAVGFTTWVAVAVGVAVLVGAPCKLKQKSSSINESDGVAFCQTHVVSQLAPAGTVTF